MKLRVTYDDGESVDVVTSPKAEVKAESTLGGISSKNQLAASYCMAWAALWIAGKTTAEWPAWLDDVAEVEKLGEENVDPTPIDPTTDESSPSPLRPESPFESLSNSTSEL